MLRYYEGTIFNTNSQTIVNTVNCFGVMGAGIALEFKLRYPEMFKKYEEMCKQQKYIVGRPRLYKDGSINILNFPTKKHWKTPSKIEWIEEGLRYFAQNYKKANITSIAFPKLGTNNGGLKWNNVKILMEKYLNGLEDIDIIICLDELDEAEGIEKKMLEDLKEKSKEWLKNEFHLNKKQVETLETLDTINRFWKISKLPSIGEKTYEKIFTYFYNKHNKKENSLGEPVQLSIF